MTKNQTDSFSTVAAHGEAEGRADYEGRADDVACGRQSADWAWPFVDAGEAYINAVSTRQICEDLGLEPEAWDEIADEWCAAFKRGYVAAKEGDQE